MLDPYRSPSRGRLEGRRRGASKRIAEGRRVEDCEATLNVGENVELELTLVTEPFRAIVVGLSCNDDGVALNAQDARDIAKGLLALADRLEALGGAIYPEPEPKPVTNPAEKLS